MTIRQIALVVIIAFVLLVALALVLVYGGTWLGHLE